MTHVKRHLARYSVVASSIMLAGSVVAASQQPQGRGGPPAPTGPMAPEKYKNIQVLTDVPADQLDVTMRFIVAATGIQCSSCHVQDATTGEWQYDKDDKNTKKTARRMMNLVKTVNAGDFGAAINCGTCHAGNNQPAGLQPAQMMTPDQVAAMMARQAAAAARQGGGGAPPAGAPGGGAGRGAQTPAPPIDDVLNKYVEGIGGRPAIEKLQAVTMTGTVTNRASQSVAFTIDEKDNKFREMIQSTPDSTTRAFDGKTAWVQTGPGKVVDLAGFPLEQLQRNADLMLAVKFKERYPNLTAGRPNRLPGAPGTTPIDVMVLTSGPASPATDYTTVTWSFDASTGLLLRKTVRTNTGLRGVLTEQWDYSDYRPVGGVKMPFEIKHTNWNTLDTYKIADIKANPSIDDGKFGRPR